LERVDGRLICVDSASLLVTLRSCVGGTVSRVTRRGVRWGSIGGGGAEGLDDRLVFLEWECDELLAGT
jgi:hypothetical protein